MPLGVPLIEHVRDGSEPVVGVQRIVECIDFGQYLETMQSRRAFAVRGANIRLERVPKAAVGVARAPPRPRRPLAPHRT